ncbi:hypothetical protein LS64_011230 [Helicobacter saguini]|uniref:Uncharacterized protein n=1 Tax=Helicobacter saguini TaxID=1548018 RepID=A0A347W1R5_9HELI|nr:hypothetical protein LS64_011230 [Helicobacter saguini]
MKILKILYICWVVFWIFVWILLFLIGHNPDGLKSFLIVIAWIILPLLIFVFYHWLRTKKRKFFYISILLLLYYPISFIAYSIYYFGVQGFFIKILSIIYSII